VSLGSVGRLLVAASVSALGLLPALPANASTTDRPVITGLSFHSAYATGGPALVIRGRHLDHTRGVTFGTVRATVLVRSAKRLRVRVPAVANPRTVHVRVATNFRRPSARGPADLFTWRWPIPVVTSMTTHLARLDGTTSVVVRGRYLGNVRDVTVGGVMSAFNNPDPSRIELQFPGHAAGTVQLRVTAEGGVSAPGPASTVRYYPPPEITSLDHRNGVTSGSTVVIQGNWLGHLHSVNFGSVRATVVAASENSVTVMAPPHAAGAVQVVLATGFGTAWTGYRYGPPNPASWSAAELADPLRGLPTAMSCPSADFCAIADETGLVTIDASGVHDTYRPTFGSWRDVECFSAARCVAWSMYNGDVSVWDGTTWSATSQPTGRSVIAATCSSASRCRLIDVKGAEAVFDSAAGQWTATGQTVAKVVALTCLDDVTCTAFAYPGVAFQLSAQGIWEQVPGQVPGGDLWSCHSGDTCTSVAGHFVMFGHRSDAGWAWQTLPDIGFDLENADCWDAAHCLALDVTGHYLTWDGAAWSSPTAYRATQDWPTVSCSGPARCEILDHQGRLYDVVDGSLAADRSVDPFRGITRLLSCPSTDFCLGVDQSGFSVTRVGASWSDPQPGALTGALSCASATFCVSASGSEIRSWDGAEWSASEPVPGTGTVLQVECPTNTFCLVLSGGTPLEWQPAHGWQAVTAGTPAHATGLTCWAAGECAAFTTSGDLVRLHDDVWELPRKIDPATIPPGRSFLTCPAADHCLIGLGPALYDVTAGGVVRNRILNEAVTQLACASETSCIVWAQHSFAVLVGGAWSVTASPPNTPLALACVPGFGQCVTAWTGQARAVTY